MSAYSSELRSEKWYEAKRAEHVYLFPFKWWFCTKG